MDKLKDKRIIAAGLFLVLFFAVGFGVQVEEEVPNNARVFVDVDKRIYYGAPTASDEKRRGHMLIETILRTARVDKYTIDKTSVNNGDFIGWNRCLFVYCLAKIGLLPDLHRWNSDGTWNY